jgi:ABC-type transport system substrate-binding protein
MVYGPTTGGQEPDSTSYGRYIPGHPLNRGYVNDPKITAMLKGQRRTKDLEARKQIIYAFQRYEAEQQYYVYTNTIMVTGSWQPYVKNYNPNLTFDYGSRAAALWLDR